MLDLVPPPAAPRVGGLSSTESIVVPPLRVAKFGGSSVGTPDRICAVTAIIHGATAAPLVVVVSAFQGVTNALLECARQAQRDDPAAGYEAIAARHRHAVRTLIARDDRVTRARVAGQLAELRSVLRGIHLLGCCPPAALDSVASFGERLSAAIVAGHLNRFRPARFVAA